MQNKSENSFKKIFVIKATFLILPGKYFSHRNLYDLSTQRVCIMNNSRLSVRDFNSIAVY